MELLPANMQPNELVLSNQNQIFIKSLHLMSCTRSSEEAEKYLTNALDAVKRTFDEITHDNCACTIKMLNSDGSVRTYLRDRQCPASRYCADIELPRYPARANSAFRILTCQSHLFTHFVSNNLSADSGYDNVNPDWMKHYNACLVAAIRPAVTCLHRRDEIFGFLCVDNRAGGFSFSEGKYLTALGYELFSAIESARATMNAAEEKLFN